LTSRWEFDIGNCEFGRLAMVMGSGAICCLELTRCETAGCSESEHGESAPLVLNLGWPSVLQSHEGRTMSDSETQVGIASSVSCWLHAVKAIESNLRDHTASRAVVPCICGAAQEVASPISVRGEGACNVLCGVREARSIDDSGDSTTLRERRGLTWCVTVRSSGREPFFERSTRH